MSAVGDSDIFLRRETVLKEGPLSLAKCIRISGFQNVIMRRHKSIRMNNPLLLIAVNFFLIIGKQEEQERS